MENSDEESDIITFCNEENTSCIVTSRNEESTYLYKTKFSESIGCTPHVHLRWPASKDKENIKIRTPSFCNHIADSRFEFFRVNLEKYFPSYL